MTDDADSPDDGDSPGDADSPDDGGGDGGPRGPPPDPGDRGPGRAPDADAEHDPQRAPDGPDRGRSGAGRDADDAPEWRAALDEAGALTPAVVDAILERHGSRGRRAIDAVGEGRVKGYEDFTVVVGHSDEYVVEEGACTCKDATYNLDPADPGALCWHALAVEIARRVGEIDHHDMYYSEVRDLL